MRLSVVRRSSLVAAVAALAFFTASCAGGSAETSEDPGAAQVAPENQGTETVVDDEGSFTEEELDGALVSSFPDDVPLYDGEVVNSLATWSDSADRPEWNAVISTGDAMDAVEGSVRDAYTTGGWEIRTDMDLGTGKQFVAHSSAYIVSITIMDAGGITINYGVSSK